MTFDETLETICRDAIHHLEKAKADLHDALYSTDASQINDKIERAITKITVTKLNIEKLRDIPFR